jgi:hypothetical protein
MFWDAKPCSGILCRFLGWVVMFWGVMSCSGMRFHMLLNVISGFGMLCRVLGCYVMFWNYMLCSGILCYVLGCDVMFWDVMSCPLGGETLPPSAGSSSHSV